MVVVDNNILSALAKIERLHYLPDVFAEVSAPVSVFEELAKTETAATSFVDDIEAVKTYNGGWLEIISPTETELHVASTIRDHALSTTDAQCIAVAKHRNDRLLTDDAHVGTIARRESVEVWDLVLLLTACIRSGILSSPDELRRVVDELEAKDNYHFVDEDQEALFDEVSS